MKKRKYLVLLLLPLLLCSFLSVGCVSALSVGKTDIGGTPSDNSYITIANNVTLPVNAILNSISVYCSSSTGDVPLNVGVYLDNGGVPDSRLVKSNETIIGLSDGWYNFSLGDVYCASGVIWLAMGSDTSGGTWRVFWDAGEGAVYKTSVYVPDPFGSGTTLSRLYSVYLNYTEYVAPTPTPSPSYTPFPEGDMSNTDWWISILVLLLIIINILLMMLPFALVRFVFGILSLFLCMLALSYQIPLSPYLQTVGLLISALAMLFSVRARE